METSPSVLSPPPASVEPLLAAALCRTCDPASLLFETTDDLKPPDEAVGQRRALDAIRFGAGIAHRGYNVFVLGPPGVGRHTVVREFLEQRAKEAETPPDWAYVYNFAEPHRPRAMRLPPGRGRPLRDDLKKLIEELQQALPAMFESDEYRTRHQALDKEIEQRREQAFSALGERAEKQGLALVRTPTGVVIVPTRAGHVIEPDEFQALPDETREKAQRAMKELSEELSQILLQLPGWAREHRDRIRALRRELTQALVRQHMAEVRAHHADLPEVTAHLDAVEHDLIENVHEFSGEGGDSEPMAAGALKKLLSDGPALHRYQVNVIIDNAGRAGQKGAPVVHEDRPSHPNLVGRIEHVARLGALMTDFTLIKPGALHAANGGYLIVDAERILREPFAYEELKRALRSAQIRIESLADMLGLQSTVSLQPEPIPLDVKVIMIGRRLLYYLLAEYDPDFLEQFKVEADFEDEVDRTAQSDVLYARLIAGLAQKEKMRPLDRGAVARVIQEGSRLAGDAHKLSTNLHAIADLTRESAHVAGLAGRSVVTAADVESAIAQQIERADRVRDRMVEEIRRGTILIDVKGARTGVINGLAVYQLGRMAFGRPTRITARVRPGRGEVIDIEREVELGGALHSKGVLILSGFLGARFAAKAPFTLGATLVFEQSYGGVDGDSASSAELYCLLSAISEVPIKQGFAVTGSVNQHGDVQAIGGVNEKIEGYFDVCRTVGLTGDQGVLIPASNVKHLMLRREVVEAVRDGKFRVYPITHIDQGIELLTGISAGARDANGKWPEGTINARVEARLLEFAEVAKAFSKGGDSKDK